MADRRTKERKLVALMANDMGISDLNESEMITIEEEVQALPDEELDKVLTKRLDLPYPVDVAVMNQALSRVEEPTRLSEGRLGGFTGAPDMSHEPRPDERPSKR